MLYLARTTAALLFAACLSLSSVAQKFNIAWGDNAKLKYDFEDAVPLANGQFIVLKLGLSSRPLFGGRPEQQPILVLIDKNLETIVEKELPIEEKNASLKGFEKYGNNIFFLYEAYEREAKTNG